MRLDIDIMKKFLLWLIVLILILISGLWLVIFTNPHLTAMVDEGFPSPYWPAKGIYVRVSGEPSRWPQKLAPKSALQSEWGKKLKELNVARETDALLAFHKGQLKYAYYRPGLNETTQFNSYSMVKSLIGMLVLKAIDEGEIESLDTAIGEYLVDLKDKNLSKQKIKAFLTMRSGIDIEKKRVPKPAFDGARRDKDPSSSNPFSTLARLHIGGLTAIESKLKISDNFSDDYHYQNVNTALLGKLLAEIYKKPLNDLLSEKIWRPSGASHAHWRTYTNEGSITAYCCLFATAMDWGKVGMFLSKNGKSGAPFLSDGTRQFFLPNRFPIEDLRQGVYGLHIRHNILDRQGEPLQGPFTYFVGHDGQVLYLMPSQDLVVIRFGRRHQLLHSTLYYLWRIITTQD